MSNICLKATIEMFSKLRFSGLKYLSAGQFWRAPQLTQISLNFKISCCNLKIRRLETKLCLAFSIILILKVKDLKSKSPWILLNKNININFNKNDMEYQKWKIHAQF